MVKLPRGQKEPTSPEWAKREKDEALLRTLENYIDGLRFVELYSLIKGHMSKPTCSAALKRLEKQRLVEYAATLKRYRITKHGLEDLRLRNVIRVMQTGFGILPPLPDPLPRKAFFAGLFAYTRPSRSKSSGVVGIGFALAGEKKRKLFWKSWLYHITSYALAQGLLRPTGELRDILPTDLTKIWTQIFPDPQEIVITEYLDSQALLNWLKTPAAERIFQEALHDFPQETLEDW